MFIICRSKKYQPLENNKIYKELGSNRACISPSRQRVKNEYYNYSHERSSKKPQHLKVNTLLRNYSENTLGKDQKASNYLNIVKMCNRGEYPQTARNNPNMSHIMENLKVNNSSSGLMSPSKDHFNEHSHRESSRNNKVSTSNSYSNIFKQRRSTQTGQDCKTTRNKGYNHPSGPSYFYHN
jgi:hypothetical protein